MIRKVFIGIFSIFVVMVLLSVFYIKALPLIISNQNTINFIQKQLENNLGIKSVIINPVLKTHFSPTIDFSIDEFELLGKDGRIASVSNLATTISFKKVLSKTIILKKLGADFIYADINKLSSLSLKKEDKKQKKNDWDIDIYNSLLYVKNSMFLYNINDTYLKFTADDLRVDNSQKEKRFVHFDLTADIKNFDKNLHFNIADNNSVYFENNNFWVKNCFLDMNDSKIYFDVKADRKKNFDAEIYSDRIFVKDVLTLIDSQLIENNLNEPLSYFKDLDGSFNFDIKISKDNIDGFVGINQIMGKVVPVKDIPITVTYGNISLTKDKVTLSDFKGYYNNKKENEFTIDGTVDDYLKSIDTKIVSRATVTHDFMKNYLSKMVGMDIDLVGGSTKTKFELSSKNNKIDMQWLFGIHAGQDILINGSSLASDEYAKGLKADMHFENNILDIKSLDYYMVPQQFLTKENKDRIYPILKFSGVIDIANNSAIKNFGFAFTRPMPSEVLNLFTGQNLFKHGEIAGNMYYKNEGSVPVLSGNLTMDKVAIPSQRLFIKHGEMSAGGNTVKLAADGGYRRSKFKFDGIIENKVLFPIAAKDVNLTVDNIDVEKFLTSSNNQNIITDKEDVENDDDIKTFDIGNIIVEKCHLKVVKGNYKEIKFNDVEADLTLDKNSILEIKSNRFDIAEGHSSAKINCDLKNNIYSMLLGIKEVNSDLIASNILQLDKEISGKASGFIKLNTDSSMRLNGSMKFDIKDGAIQKVGLVEYVLKFAALFRNPLTMISPSIFSDLVNVPDGNFSKINGQLELKDNVIERMMIKSSSPQLSAFVVGNYNLETSDASLRIYTKLSNKNKGVFGFLRNISLNSLANRIPLNARNDSIFYSAEISQLPEIDADEKDCQIFLTRVDGDIEHNNFISSLKKIK
ncbi:hypothetical protein J6P92_04885 [bacterium]|nr:hypothetical protein [bacterium]